MKRFVAIACASCALALTLALAGCGGSPSAIGAANTSDDAAHAEAMQAFAGTWDLSGMSQDGSKTSSEEIEMLASLGMEVYLDLEEDGTAELTLFTTPLKGTWDASSPTKGTISLSEEGEPAVAVDMTIDGNVLKMEQDDASLTFEKGEPRGDTAAADDAGESSQGAAAEPSESGESGSSAAA